MDYWMEKAKENLTLFKLGQQVAWWIRSEENPLWNHEGTSVLRPGGGPPQELVMKMEDLRVELGDVPEDLNWGYQK